MLDKKQIDQLAYSLRNRSWANRHYKEGEAIIDFGVHQDGHTIIFMADVANNWESVSCNLTIYRGQITDTNCDCFFHDKGNACGHIIAAGYFYVDYIQDKEDKTEITYIDVLKDKEYHTLRKNLMREVRNNKKMIQDLLIQEKEDFEILLQKDKYRLEFELKTQYQTVRNYANYYQTSDATPYIALRAKIGDERMYVVKSFPQLLEQINHKEKVSYGKHLTIVHDESVFDVPTRSILNDLKILLNTDQTIAKEIRIDKTNIGPLYDMLKKLPEHYHNVELNEQDLAAEIEVEMFDDNTYILRIIEDHDYVYQDSYYYQIGENNGKATLNRFVVDHPLVNKTLEVLFENHYMTVDTTSLLSLMRAFETTPEIKLLGTPKLDIERVNSLKLYLDVESEALQIKFDVETEQGKIINGIDEQEHLRLPDIVSRVYARLSVLNHFIVDDIMTVSLLEPETFQFLEYGLEKISQDVEVYASESLKEINKPTSLKIQVGVNVNHGLLEVDVSSFQVSQEDLAEVLRMYRRKKKYHRLNNGLILNLESKDLKELDEITRTLELDDRNLNKPSKVPLYRAFQIEGSQDTFNTLNFSIDKNLKDFTNQFTAISLEKIHVNQRFRKILKPYQIHGVKWLSLLSQAKLSGILADDMGLGKTLQVIAYLEGQKREKPSLVVCPASLMYNWEEEFKKFESPLKTLCIHGTQEHRKTMIDSHDDYDVLITTYDYLRLDIELYDEIKFESMIIDEAQYIKNANTKSAKVVKQIDSQHRIALSGTPIENRLSELWSIFDFLMPGYLYTYNYFRKYFERPIVAEQNETVILRLRSLVEPFILRRSKQEVLEDLPDKSEKILSLDFNEKEEKLYLAKLAEGNESVSEILDMENPNKLQILKILGDLRQICCDPRLLYEDFKEPSTKMKGAMEVIESVIDREEKVLVFSSFTSTLDLLEEMLNHHNIKYYTLTGKTSKEERRELVDAFQEDQTGVFLMSLKAAGVGLNLTAAQNVIHFDPWWNVSAENQATDRTHRIGQTKDVNVFKLIMKNSIEEKILKMQESKKQLADMFVEGSTGSFSSMTKDEILELFK